MRYLGLDLGTRTLGCSISDETGLIASTLKTIRFNDSDYEYLYPMIEEIVKEYNVKTIVSMNPVMIDGTGMCGGCRVIVGGETKFACVDGPDFDGHQIDWEAALNRQKMFKAQEKTACESGHCRIGRTNNA